MHPVLPEVRPAGGDSGLDELVAEIKSALPLSDTITRISGISLEPCSSGSKACCPFHRESTPSFFVDDTSGRYKCFGAGCGVGGDVIQFIREWHSVGFGEALRLASELACLPPPRPYPGRRPGRNPVEYAAWRSIIVNRPVKSPVRRPSADFLRPFPDGLHIPRPGERIAVHDPAKQRVIRMKPTHVHEYRSEDGSVTCLVLRANARGGRKFFIQAGWHDGPEGSGWKLIRFPRNVARPVYGLSGLPGWVMRKGSTILMVEGEKTCDAAALLLPQEKTGVLSLSAMGGGAAVRHADWSPLAKAFHSLHRDRQPQVDILIWPDADKPAEGRDGRLIDRQLKFAEDMAGSIRQALKTNGHTARFSRILPPADVSGGWDLADALDQGWSGSRTSSHIERFRASLDEINDPEFKPGHVWNDTCRHRAGQAPDVADASPGPL